MRKGFLRAEKKAGYDHSIGSDTTAEAPLVRQIREQLAEAERKLRHLREKRLRSAKLAGAVCGGATTTANECGTLTQAQPSRRSGLPSLDKSSLEALAALKEPVAEPTHRLGEALMLLLEARVLVDLGQAPLPGRVRWSNLQMLLRKPSCVTEDAGSIVAVISRKPFGRRLAGHVRERLDAGNSTDAVTREKVAKIDVRFGDIFDFVMAVLADASEEGEGSGGAPEAPSAIDVTKTGKSPEAESEDTSAEEAEAVVQQERKVAQLRRQLREAERSEKAAQDFASTHDPATNPRTSSDSVATPAVVDVAPSVADGKSSKVETNNSTHITKIDADPAETSAEPASFLQYRLGEIEVPAIQEFMLTGLLRTALDPRDSRAAQRTLEVIGRSEDREEANVALQRAEAVRDWLLKNGVQEEAIHVNAVAGGGRANRRTELRVLDADVGVIRKKAETIMSRLLGGSGSCAASDDVPRTGDANRSAEAGVITSGSIAPGFSSAVVDGKGVNAQKHVLCTEVVADVAEDEAAATSPPSPPSRRKTSEKDISSEEINTCTQTRPRVSVEETNGVGPSRALKVVFTDLTADSTDLEVGEQAVRLMSRFNRWGPVEVPLPFAVDTEQTSAKFSRKAGTLTVRLRAAADASG
eukprot:TRINITY_DN43501_c0_g1_i1.p1 TRINITY_DN43501_c0_g1~~TRINITY_DN43501_c0_g1_i1.p1  ORF type:complete len:640 (-),score=121.76 TRINITY_DN43501_c0_g1_i1:91-2010(-)